jgi:uncharacterized protein DUF397
MWRKSSHSTLSNCVEAASWRKSTASAAGNCVEVAHGAAVVGVRDSQDRDGGRLELSPAAWAAFTGRLKSGRGPR